MSTTASISACGSSYMICTHDDRTNGKQRDKPHVISEARMQNGPDNMHPTATSFPLYPCRVTFRVLAVHFPGLGLVGQSRDVPHSSEPRLGPSAPIAAALGLRSCDAAP